MINAYWWSELKSKWDTKLLFWKYITITAVSKLKQIHLNKHFLSMAPD